MYPVYDFMMMIIIIIIIIEPQNPTANSFWTRVLTKIGADRSSIF